MLNSSRPSGNWLKPEQRQQAETILSELARRRLPYRLHGGNLAAYNCRESQFILSGPSETGKTIALLQLAHRLALTYPGAQGAIVRKVYETLTPTVLQTLERKIYGEKIDERNFKNGIVAYGGEKPQWFQYPNGSRVWVGGIDKPGKTLSAERDFVYVNQAEELTLEDWQTLSTRTTGRAGTIAPGLLFGDCNPRGQQHWIQTESRAGRLTVFHSNHKDNPALYDSGVDEWTEQGTRTIERLSRLTGHTHARLFLGQWVSPEGLVYANFTDDNLTAEEPDSELPIEIAFDDGYVDPRAILFIQRTPTRILIFDEMYHSYHLESVCIGEMLEKCGQRFGWVDEEKTQPAKLPEIAIGSPEAKTMQVLLRRANVPCRFRPHKIVDRINHVRSLVYDGNGYRAMQVNRRCRNLIYELTEGYQYPPQGSRQDGETPLDRDNHAVDALGYWAMMRVRV